MEHHAAARKHSWPAGTSRSTSFLFPFLANGVTLVQSMSATPEELVVRERINRGELLGPRMILAPMIDGPGKAWPPPLSTWVASATEAHDAVHRAKHDGYDKIKVYSFLNKESYDSIISSAGEVQMDVIGHIPMSLSLDYVLDAGQKLIAHSEEVAKHAGGDHSAEHIADIAARMAESGVWMTPTLVTTRSILQVFADSDGLLNRPEAAYFRHPMQQGIWSFITNNLYRPIPAQAREKIRTDFETFQKPLTRAFHEGGGKLMTGTDTLFPGLVPGFALHRELEELVEVGLTPFESLRTSTTAPFEYLGESDRAGTDRRRQGDRPAPPRREPARRRVGRLPHRRSPGPGPVDRQGRDRHEDAGAGANPRTAARLGTGETVRHRAWPRPP